MEDKNIDFAKKQSKTRYNLPVDVSSGLQDLFAYFENNQITYNNFTTDSHKTAYPNYEHFVSLPGTHNIEKWMSALREILYLEKSGSNRVGAIKKVTADWKEMEVFDFLNWVKFYENKDHLKYSKAQFMPNHLPNYFLNLKDKGELQDKNDIDFATSHSANRMSLSEKKKIIERQRNKIIGRLDSAEKLLRTEEGEMFAGDDLESLIQAIYALKTKIQLVNKLSLATKLYEDMIVREANVLHKKGFIKGASVLKLLAEGTDISELSPQSLGPVSSPAPLTVTPNSPQIPSNDLGRMNSVDESANKVPLPDMEVEEDIPEVEVDENAGIRGFLNNLNDGGFTTSDTLEIDDDALLTEAQVAPNPAPAQPPVQESKPKLDPLDGKVPRKETNVNVPKTETKQPPKNNQDNLEIDEDADLTPSSSSKVDNMIDSLFSNITVEDVIQKLEDLSKVFNTREIPRQLALLDMMLDSLGLATYFPSLPEATNKALESNNYIASRIDDILSKLRGNMGHDLDLGGEDNREQSPEIQRVQQSLENEQEKDKKRKEMRKEKEDKSLEESLKPEPELDLGELSLDEEPTQTPAQPVAPPPAQPKA